MSYRAGPCQAMLAAISMPSPPTRKHATVLMLTISWTLETLDLDRGLSVWSGSGSGHSAAVTAAAASCSSSPSPGTVYLRTYLPALPTQLFSH